MILFLEVHQIFSFFFYHFVKITIKAIIFWNVSTPAERSALGTLPSLLLSRHGSVLVALLALQHTPYFWLSRYRIDSYFFIFQAKTTLFKTTSSEVQVLQPKGVSLVPAITVSLSTRVSTSCVASVTTQSDLGSQDNEPRLDHSNGRVSRCIVLKNATECTVSSTSPPRADDMWRAHPPPACQCHHSPYCPRPTLLDSLYRTVVECVLPGRHLVNKWFKNIFSYLLTLRYWPCYPKLKFILI